jgi:hypothetical protein
MYEVQSTKYQVPPFEILQSAFDIGFNSVFRLPAAGRYFVSRTFYPNPLL